MYAFSRKVHYGITKLKLLPYERESMTLFVLDRNLKEYYKILLATNFLNIVFKSLWVWEKKFSCPFGVEDV